ncbi:glycosyltransferase family 4 protein [soil metagenome]
MTGRNTPLHVLFTTDTVGGVWDFSRTLSGELRSRGQQVTLLALGGLTPEQRRQADLVTSDVVSAPLRLEWMQGSADDVLRTRELVEMLVRIRRPDLVHANQYAAVTACGVPTVLTAHSDVLSWHRWTRRADEAELASLRRSPYASTVEAALAGASSVVAVSGSVAADLREHYGLARPVRVVHNGWPAVGEEPAPLAARPRRTLLGGRAWDEAKNVAIAARAAAGWDPGELLLAGEIRHPETGSRQPIAGVRALGFLSRGDLDAQLAAARVYLGTARYEPFGLLALQAALHGCALVLNDIPSYREVWDGAAAFYARDDPAALRDVWRSVLDDGGKAQRLARAARERAVGRYSASRMADEYLDAYEQATRGRGRREQRGLKVPWQR